MEKVTFKKIPHFENYIISPCGKIVINTLSDRTLSVRNDKDGYPRVVLFKKIGGKVRRFDYVLHILSAMAWIQGDFIPSGFVVDHIDDDRENPHYINLRVVTPEVNLKKALKNIPHIKLDMQQAREIRAIISFGIPEDFVTEAYGICKRHLRRIVGNRIWREDFHGGEICH